MSDRSSEGPNDTLEKAAFAISLTAIPLRKLNAEREVIDNASGCLVDYFGHRLLLTAAHRGLADGNWAIEVGFDREHGTRLYQVGGLNYVARLEWKTLRSEEIDFAYASVPRDVIPLYQEIGAGGYILKEVKRPVFAETFETEPDSMEVYSFAGQVEFSKENWLYCSKVKAVMGLTFHSTVGDFHSFRLPYQHPGHDAFHGCSGAPIMDSEARVVALVCGGNTTEHTIHGISLKKMKPILDIHTGRFC